MKTKCERCNGNSYLVDEAGYFCYQCPDCGGKGEITTSLPKPTLGEIWGAERWGKS